MSALNIPQPSHICCSVVSSLIIFSLPPYSSSRLSLGRCAPPLLQHPCLSCGIALPSLHDPRLVNIFSSAKCTVPVYQNETNSLVLFIIYFRWYSLCQCTGVTRPPFSLHQVVSLQDNVFILNMRGVSLVHSLGYLTCRSRGFLTIALTVGKSPH